MERSTEEIEKLKSGIQEIKFGLTDKANQLTKKRRAAARELEKKVETELGHLGMKKTTFTVKITQEPGGDTFDGLKLGPRGADRVEFLISPNPGEEPKPLAKIASGGELSRIMLALKTILVEGDSIPTLVFDEVDAGIGGAVAEEVGKKLKRVAIETTGLLHHPSAADREHGREPLRCYQVREEGPDEHRGAAARQTGTRGRDRAHARRKDDHRGHDQACRGDDRAGSA